VKFTLRIISFSIAALALVWVPAAKADTLTPCKVGPCTFALTAYGTSLTDPSIAISINLNLVGIPLSSVKNPDYGITDATGTITIGGVLQSFTFVAETPALGIETKAPVGSLNYDDKLIGKGDHNLDTRGLLLEIPGLSDPKGKKSSDYWVLEWYADGGYYELQNTLVTSDVYQLGTTLNVTNTPEPITLVLFGSGLVGIGGLMRRRWIG
jgi:uncharacterized protein (DUF697 family)